MVWAAIGKRGKMRIVFLDGKVTAAKYVEMLDGERLDEEGRRICGDSFIFQQDNAPINTAKLTSEYLTAMGINVLPWPARSPDMNPIENC